MELEWAESEIRLLPGVYACGASDDGVVVFVDPYHDAAATEEAALGVLGILGLTLPLRMVGGAAAALPAAPARAHVRAPAAAAMAAAAAILVAGAASALATFTGGSGHHHVVASPAPLRSGTPLAPPPGRPASPVVTSPPVPTPPTTAAQVTTPQQAPLLAAAVVPASVRHARPVRAVAPAILTGVPTGPATTAPPPPLAPPAAAEPSPTQTPPTTAPPPTTSVPPLPVAVPTPPPPAYTACQTRLSPWESPEWRRAKYGECAGTRHRHDGCDGSHDWAGTRSPGEQGAAGHGQGRQTGQPAVQGHGTTPGHGGGQGQPGGRA